MENFKNKIDGIQKNEGLNLETKRFNLSQETLNFLKQARLDLQELQKTASFLYGFSFFGSRMNGTEKQDSDLDIAVLYDNNSLTYTDWREFALPFKYFGKDDIRGMEGMVDIKLSVKDWLNEINKNRDFKVPYHPAVITDISYDGIKENIHDFSSDLKHNPGNDRLHYVWPMITPFFLSIGDNTYKARSEIFSELESRSDGEKLWQEIVKKLNYIDREGPEEKRKFLPDFKQYPQTIVEAKKFFLLKEPNNL